MSKLRRDVTTGFDSVDREVLERALRERRIREGLVEKVEELWRETRSKVREGGKMEEFLDGEGIRQRCLLSPVLFNILLADLEKEMGKVK